VIKEYTTNGLLRKRTVRVHNRQGRILLKEFRKIITATRSCARRDKRANRVGESLLGVVAHLMVRK